MTESYLQRFGGMARLYGSEALPRLHAARVAIIGVGGVGSWVVEALARSGIGALNLIDLDDVCITNTNRQLPALDHTIGKTKVQVLADRVREINPECTIAAVSEFLLASNADRLLSDRFDLIVDAVDSTGIKALIIAKARDLGIPVIVSGSAGGRRDPTMIKASDLGLAGADELIKQLRRRLRDEYAFPKSPDGLAMNWGVQCVYSTEPALYPQADGTCSTKREADAEPGQRLDCAAGFGASSMVTGSFGLTLAALAVRQLITPSITRI
jgi:tRNA A37 threonylcarbamoyladenosine dehydratase